MKLLARAQILALVMAELKQAGLKALRSRTLSVKKKDLPVLLVYYEGDNVDPEETTSGAGDNDYLVKELSISIEAVSSAADESKAEEELDSICAKTIRQLEVGASFKDVLLSWYITSTQFEFSGGGEESKAPLLSAKMIWIFQYRVEETNPDTII